ncbi:MAG TPA: DciA family protein [Steroidobacteraceae bacterium]|nr:DciA family protein [Steroidobacteraceae bacterium]
MKKPRSINELISRGGKRLSDLKSKAQARTRALEHVCAALPSPLARSVVSAGLEHGQLTIGVAGAAWAARLRYVTEALRTQVGTSMSVDIHKVRIKVVPPREVAAQRAVPPRA